MSNPLLEKLWKEPKLAMELVPYKIGTLALPKILLVLAGDIAETTETSPEENIRDFILDCVSTTIEKIILEQLLQEVKKEMGFPNASKN